MAYLQSIFNHKIAHVCVCVVEATHSTHTAQTKCRFKCGTTFCGTTCCCTSVQVVFLGVLYFVQCADYATVFSLDV